MTRRPGTRIYGDSWRRFESWPWWGPLVVAGVVALGLIMLVVLL